MPIGLATSRYSHNPFGEGFCGFNAFIIMMTCGVSTQSLMLIALERYFLICQSQRYKRFFSKPLIAGYIAFTWIYSAIWTCQGWTGWTRYIYGLDIWLCLFDGTFSISYDVCLVLFGMLLPMGILCFCYTKIFLLVHKNNKIMKQHRQRPHTTQEQDNLTDDQKRSKKELRLTVTLFVIVLVFSVCWTPASIVLLLSGVWTDMPKSFYTVAVWFAFANSSMNSILYGFMNKNFRDGYKRVLLTMFCCKKDDCNIAYHCPCTSSEEHSNSSRQHSNDTAKTDTLSKRKNMIIRGAKAVIPQRTRPNSVSDIKIDPVHLWSPEEVDRSCKYMQQLSTDSQVIEDQDPFEEDCETKNHPAPPGSVATPETRPSSCRSRVTTIFNEKEEATETQL
uniref:Orphan G-protein coupled receptor 32 n=1 Tax=Platynereis dumerilii TaxID=6359 RepID=A0A0K0PUT5_PLADU|nr:orphan G-protein coupled receptor 32 [Platynereis dumerilii]